VRAEIITIGDEILIGQTIDTNAAYIASKLNDIGVNVTLKRTIADRADAIAEALDQVNKETTLVFMTGGLGPTNDDITKKTLNDYFDGELVFNEEVYRNIEAIFSSFNRTPQEVHRYQAYLPSTARVLINSMGTASGMHFEKEGKHFFSMPGVPYEAEHLVKDRVIPWILENLQKGTVIHRTILTQGVPESDLAEMLTDFENKLPEGISMAYLPSPGMVKLRLTSYEGNPVEREEQIANLIDEMKQILGDVVYGENIQTLEQVIGEMLEINNKTLSLAESCTGGSIASRITAVPGASKYFLGSIVSYATEVKEEVLVIDSGIVDQYGVVSEKMAQVMAEKARKLFNTDYAVSTTGIAGPDGGTPELPVGSVWIGISGPSRTKAWYYRFGRNRGRNIQKATVTALNLLRREIQKNEEH
jgi:nicotinamide-nucleotide amidase